MAVRSTSTDASSASGSASTISAETETGYHVLTIEGYSQTKGLLGVGYSVKSGNFTVGGHTWCVRYYPDGFDEETVDWICFDLFLDAAAAADENVVKVKHSFSLIDKAGDPVPPYTSTSGVYSLSHTTPSWGYQWLTPEMESSPHLADDSFSIRFDIIVIKAIRATRTTTTTTTATKPPHTPSDRKLHIAHPKIDLGMTNVVIEVGGEVFAAHRWVLANKSPVFTSMLFGMAAAEDDHGVVHLRIDNMEARVFEALLYFVYVGALPEMDHGDEMEMARLLLVAANRYDLHGLKLACEDVLQGYIDKTTVVGMLSLATKHRCHKT
ncbi:hypothetical protein PR202_gb13425 [Eleusine coracana subsp. coracana]|uniref:Uncharacterized protein n=1 Tax=Eleusine coracana subsp. coracana TaxID=191504 RepID=A0AAV5ESE5_ELECO|nr:hypothetical protein QOZ80_9BG0714630 [Eleusine coracana subsp. coracana]GJN25580.1 hypothetical protein PR202_gb13425 [Eleusine coracana subsp. coracana]